MKKIVLLSGGVDSTTCLAMALQDAAPDEIMALSVSYGQRHIRELESARAVSDFYSVRLAKLDLSAVFAESDCSLLTHSGVSVPHGTYAEQGAEGKPVSTYVPFRNGMMISAAAAFACSAGASEIWCGIHADDAAGNAYPDCSETFFRTMNEAVKHGTGGKVRLICPFVSKGKAEVVRIGMELNAPYRLTWSCYEGGARPCGKCATCIDRRRAFEANGIKDPNE